MKVLRTPDERFQNLPGWSYEARFAEIPDGDDEGGTLRVHYIDEGGGSPDAGTVLLLHGEPSWGYLYRHMVPILVEAGHRVVVPDQVGFGRSDKPAEQSDYSYARHVAWMSSLVFDELDLNDITFFAQDWGGLIGLRLVAAQPERYARVMISNTALPTGDVRPSDAFMAWQEFSQTTPEFPVGGFLNQATLTELSEDVIAAYDAPFPDETYKAGARIWPSFVPTSPDDPEAPANREAWEVLRRFDKPFLCCFSDSDPITAGADRPFREQVPGAAGQPHTTIENGGHFVQEDQGPLLARMLVDFIAS